MKDFVKCNNCEEESFVDLGENICPRCMREGTLQWVTVECNVCGKAVEPQEVEEYIDKSQGLKIYVCDSCATEGEEREEYDEQILNLRVKSDS